MSFVLLDSGAHEITIYNKPSHRFMFPFEMAAYEYDSKRDRLKFSRKRLKRYIGERCGEDVAAPGY